jgi:hypothetical protein
VRGPGDGRERADRGQVTQSPANHENPRVSQYPPR